MATLDFLNEIHVEIAPKIYKGYNMDNLGDVPDLHRWRARWSNSGDGVVTGIELVAHPVVSVTRCGAWVDPNAWCERQRDGLAWHLSGEKRWVSNDGGQAWAKPTQEAALYSIAVRLHRWSQKLYHETRRLREAAEVLKVLRPQDQSFAHRAIETLDTGSLR
jgi:hypothetical protein